MSYSLLFGGGGGFRAVEVVKARLRTGFESGIRIRTYETLISGERFDFTERERIDKNLNIYADSFRAF